MRDTNNATNFINPKNGAFEKTHPSYTTDELPNKVKAPGTQTDLGAVIKDLKSSHFTAGGESGARMPTNTCYGGFGRHSPDSTVKKGMGLGTNFVLGSDNQDRMTEARSRFAGTAGGIGIHERTANKTKMSSDSV